MFGNPRGQERAKDRREDVIVRSRKSATIPLRRRDSLNSLFMAFKGRLGTAEEGGREQSRGI